MANVTEPNYDNSFVTEGTEDPTQDWINLQNWHFLSSGWDITKGDDTTHYDTVISALLNTFGGVFADTAEAISKLFGLYR